jgi:predicted phosphoadenosine phosphosulfate sulfurtransferase
MSDTGSKRALTVDVLTAARERCRWALANFPRVYMAGPSGKDSTVMMHILCREARAMGRKVGALYIDLEAQYRATIDCVSALFSEYADVIEPYWVALPLHLRNAVSMEQPYWVCWEQEAKERWVRQPPEGAITDPKAFPFFRPAMEFEEFIEEFGPWYGNGERTACLVGIRSDESINRWRAITSTRKTRCEGKAWTTVRERDVVNVYPIYDWRTEDVWTYVAKEGVTYNRIYDRMHEAGLSVHQMRICQPYGDDQRKGLHLYHVLEPETWTKVVSRVIGANSGAMYCQETGNVMGQRRVDLPPGHTWESYTRLLLSSLPIAEREHYLDKFAVFIEWWRKHGFPDGIPDEADPKLEATRKAPSWRRLCRVILKNDRMCKALSFGQQRSDGGDKYKAMMQRRRSQWREI